MGFIENIIDATLFIFRGNHIIYILVYVDDMIITGLDYAKIDQLMEVLDSEFLVHDLGQLHFFLGIRVW